MNFSVLTVTPEPFPPCKRRTELPTKDAGPL
jgi:hypothetical protein